MLLGRTLVFNIVFRVLFTAVLTCAAAETAGAPLIPLTVCEAVRDLESHDGRELALLGRYSFRESGRSLNEQTCGNGAAGPPRIQLVENIGEGPKLPGNFELDGAELRRKFANMQTRTSLGKFRFGTPDYDRWAVIYGRLRARKGDDAKTASADLVFRGGGVVVFLTPDE